MYLAFGIMSITNHPVHPNIYNFKISVHTLTNYILLTLCQCIIINMGMMQNFENIYDKFNFVILSNYLVTKID